MNEGIYQRFVKRLLDIIFALCGLLFGWPLLLIVWIAVKIKIGGPAVFRQIRPGKDGKPFKMYKFRSMTDEKDENGKLLPDEKRLTKFGRFIRHTSLDEIPEIINILKGDMSVVGPRPMLIKDYVFMSDEIKRRHCVRQGLTGLAQISGRNNVAWDKRYAIDLEYVDGKITFGKDFRISLKTVGKVLKRENIDSEDSDGALDYGDWLLKEGRITPEYYDEKIKEAEKLEASFE